jgi:Leucine-rich repeat (LRR) protein
MFDKDGNVEPKETEPLVLRGPASARLREYAATGTPLPQIILIDPEAEALELLRLLKPRSLKLISRTGLNVEQVNELGTLEDLSVETNGVLKLDFSRLTCLRSCGLIWRGTIENLGNAENLQTLRIVDWPHQDLGHLSPPPILEELTVYGGRLQNLTGIERFGSLRSLSLVKLPALRDIEGLGTLRGLEHLRIDTCKRIDSIVPISECANLLSLDLDNVGDVDSLAPVRNLRRLRSLLFREDTNVLDGDTNIVNEMRIDKYGFKNRRHYNFNYNHLLPPGRPSSN